MCLPEYGNLRRRIIWGRGVLLHLSCRMSSIRTAIRIIWGRGALLHLSCKMSSIQTASSNAALIASLRLPDRYSYESLTASFTYFASRNLDS